MYNFIKFENIYDKLNSFFKWIIDNELKLYNSLSIDLIYAFLVFWCNNMNYSI